MSPASTTVTAITLSMASIVVALGIDASPAGEAGPAAHVNTRTAAVPARREVVPSPYPAEGATGESEVFAETPELLDEVEWALTRYEEAGLELPTMVIHAHTDRSGCGGLLGYFSRTEAGDYEVHTCGVEFTLLHELGHAWVEHNLDEQTKAEFIAHAAADEWIGDSWLTSASEHAANTLAWGLMGTRINQTRTYPKDHASMLEAFEILTGGDPLWLKQ